MSYLAAAVGLLTLLTLFNLVLLLGVIRRLREYSDRLGSAGGAGVPRPEGQIVPAGATIGAFTTATVDGETVSSDLLDGETLVGFFSPTCQPCKVQLPRFAAYAKSFAGGRDRVLAVITTEGPGDDAEPYVAALAEVARVVVEPYGGPLFSAFTVSGFPSVALVDAAGTVQATAGRVGDLAAARPKAARG